MVANARRIVGGMTAGATAFAVLGVVEVSTRLHQYGGLQIIGPPRPSLGADVTQVATLIVVLALAALFATFVLPVLGGAGSAALVLVTVALALASWILFTEPTYAAYGRSMDFTVDGIAHAASTSASTFVFAGLCSVGLFRRLTRAAPSREELA